MVAERFTKVDAILKVVGARMVTAIVCTHAHDDHVRVASALRERTKARVLPHPGDRPLWELTHGTGEQGELRDGDLTDGQLHRGRRDDTADPAPTRARPQRDLPPPRPRLGLRVHRRPLFNGGSGATGQSYSDRPVLLRPARHRGLRPHGPLHPPRGDRRLCRAEVPDFRSDLDGDLSWCRRGKRSRKGSGSADPPGRRGRGLPRRRGSGRRPA
ncbi:MBL fold metallo-hydrolase [Streptomyces phaeolivaceus]|uniref:MBL fold metallo-hydrolase n=1 Tax=Streptomyces phaeolivaceus TaxID=2653200 RepID=UPI00385030FE